MIRRVTGFLVMLCAFLLISVGLMPRVPVTYAAELKICADSSGIRIVSGEPTICMDNMAPGDSKEAVLIIENNSSNRYLLAVSADIEEGNVPLEISIGNVYVGPLSNLQGINIGSYPAGSAHTLPMEITLPMNAGNIYQGQSSKVMFRVTSSIQSSSPPSGPGGGDPDDPVTGDEPGQDPNLPVPVEEDPKPVLPVTGAYLDLLIPIGLVMFLIGILLVHSDYRKGTPSTI